jgi:hypothetical protein
VRYEVNIIYYLKGNSIFEGLNRNGKLCTAEECQKVRHVIAKISKDAVQYATKTKCA